MQKNLVSSDRGFESNLRVIPGFYVMKMKKDPTTGHNIGVATGFREADLYPALERTMEASGPSRANLQTVTSTSTQTSLIPLQI
jgi:hypothetical protein